MKKTILMIIVAVIIAGVSGGGVYLWQNNKLNLEKQVLQNQITDLQKTNQALSTNKSNNTQPVANSALFTVKKIDFAKQSSENFDKNDPYYNVIINNLNKRLGKVLRYGDSKDITSEVSETGASTYSLTNDGFLFVTYDFQNPNTSGFGHRIAKIDLKTGTVVSENYFFPRADGPSGAGPGTVMCYYNGDKNQILFKSEIVVVGDSVKYRSWDLSKKSISTPELVTVPINNDSELGSYCK